MKYNIRWIVLALMLVLSFVAYLLRTNLSIVAGEMSRDLSLTEQQLGYIFSAFSAGYAIFQLPGGLLGSKFGPRLVLSVAAVLWGILTIVTALVPGTDTLSVSVIVGLMIVLRFLVGATHAPLFPCVGGMIANWFPRGKWGLPNGLTSTGLTLGGAATAPIVVWLMASYGWRGALIILAPSSFVLAALWWWYVRDYPDQHRDVTSQELELVNRDKRPPLTAVPPGTLKRILNNRDLWLVTISYTCMNYIFYLFFNWFYYYLTEIRGFGNTEAGFLSMALWVLGALGATAGGFICDSLNKKVGLRWAPALMCSIALGLVGAALLAGVWTSQPYLAVALFCLAFGCTQITEAAFWSSMISISGRHSSTAGGVMNTGGNVIGLLGGLMVPWIAGTAGWDMAIASGAVFAFIGAVLWFWVRSDITIQRNPEEST